MCWLVAAQLTVLLLLLVVFTKLSVQLAMSNPYVVVAGVVAVACSAMIIVYNGIMVLRER